MTEQDQTGAPDGRHGSGRPANEPAADDGSGGRTKVIHTADRPGSDHTGPVTGPGRAPGAKPPTVHIPLQTAGPRAAPAPPAYGAPAGGYPPPAPGYGQPTAVGYGAVPAYGAPAGHGAPAGYGAGGYGAPGYDAPPAGYGPAYGAPGSYPPAGTPGYGAYPPTGGYPPPGAPPPGFGPAPSGRRRGVLVLVALVAVVALVAGGVVTWLSLRGGGGDTPAEATHLLADDLQSGSWAKAVSRVHPDEVALGADLTGMLRDELVRLEVLRPDVADDALVSGVTFANLQLDDNAVEQVRPDVAIAKLTGGTITVNRDVDTLPLTDSYKKIAYPDGVPVQAPEVIDIATVAARQGHPVRIATVQVGDDWFVSPFYTIADSALLESGEAWPQGTVTARGSATAQDALRDGVTALFAQDVRRLVELAPPNELAVLHDVGPLLVQKAGTPRPTGRLVDLATTQAEVAGGTALTITRLVVEDTRGSRVTVVRDGDCLSVTQTRSFGSGGGPTRVCADQLAAQGTSSMSGIPGSTYDATDPAVRDVTVKAARAALGLKIVVVQVDGQYYMSPARTLVGLGTDVLGTLQPADLARLAEATR